MSQISLADTHIPKAGMQAILALGVTQIIGYGTTYYLLAVLGPNIARELNISQGLLLGGISLSFIAGSLLGPISGRYQDRNGSRVMMATGSLGLTTGLLILSQAHGVWSYYVGWIVIALASPFSLYSSSFTSLTRLCGRSAPRAITYLTLIAGLASTIIWPLAAWMLTFLDWRSIVLIYAAINALISAPLHYLVLEGAVIGGQTSTPKPIVASLSPEARPYAFRLFTLMLTCISFVQNAWSMLAFALLIGLGYDIGTAVLIASAVGVFQTLGRFLEMLFGPRIGILRTTQITNGLYAIAFLLLTISQGSLVVGLFYAAIYGMANGLNTIIKGNLTLAMFGSAGYGERMGKLTILPGLAAALGPILGGLLIEAYGVGSVIASFICLCLLAFSLMVALNLHCKSHGMR